MLPGIRRPIAAAAFAPCWPTFIDEKHVSFYAERSPSPGAGYIEARTAKDVFAANFEPASFGAGPNPGYARTKPFPKTYPDDFRR